MRWRFADAPRTTCAACAAAATSSVDGLPCITEALEMLTHFSPAWASDGHCDAAAHHPAFSAYARCLLRGRGRPAGSIHFHSAFFALSISLLRSCALRQSSAGFALSATSLSFDLLVSRGAVSTSS